MARLVVTLKPDRLSTRVLATFGQADVLKAVLPSPPQMHPQAAERLLQALSLAYRRALSAVVCVDDRGTSYELGLCDGLGFGRSNEHFEVELYDPGRRQRGMGPFEDLRQLALRGMP